MNSERKPQSWWASKVRDLEKQLIVARAGPAISEKQYIIRSVICPTCRAMPKSACVDSLLKKSLDEHQARYELAENLGLWSIEADAPPMEPSLTDKHIPVSTYSSPVLLVIWGMVFTVLILLPTIVYLTTARLSSSVEEPGTVLSISLGLLSTTFLFVSLGISRIRPLINSLGIEVVIRAHRAFALAGALFVIAHVVWAVANDSDNWSDFGAQINPFPSTSAQKSGEIATLAVLLAVVAALSRRRRRPRYEGWRLWHVILSWFIILFTIMHVLFLDLLGEQKVLAWTLFGYLISVAVLMLYRWLYRPLRAHFRAYIVDEVRKESETVVTLVIHARGHRGAKFKPGQFAWIKVGGSAFVFEEHPFTISSSSTDSKKKEITIKGLGDYTEHVAGIRPGRKIFLDGPYGRFTLDEARKSKGFVFIAGGVGITPMISMIRTLADRGDTRPQLLITAANTVEELLFRDEIDELASRTEIKIRVVDVLGSPPPGWSGERGRINLEILKRHLHPHRRIWINSDYFVCGAPLMVASVVKLLQALGVPEKRVHTELFDLV